MFYFLCLITQGASGQRKPTCFRWMWIGRRLETNDTIRYEVESFRALPSVNDETSKAKQHRLRHGSK